MGEYQFSKNDLVSEADVETKIVLPLLQNSEPQGLGYTVNQIQSKVSLKKLLIDKGNKAHLYYPDFVVNVDGVPVIVVETKKPGEDLLEGFRQASLYASEINRFYGNGINPIQLILATDGLNLVGGYWDSSSPKYTIKSSEFIVTNSEFSGFLSDFAASKLIISAKKIRALLRTDAHFRNPLYMVGGAHIQGQSVNNSFGEAISIEYEHIFNPSEEAEREQIVKNAYVEIPKHQSHVQPIDRLIQKKIGLATELSTTISNNTKPKEITSKLQKAANYNNKVILLVGSVGSGKSTFSTYLREVALDKATVDKTCWVKLDLNDAPVNAQEIYTWVKRKIIDQLKNINHGTDFDELSFLQKLYSLEIEGLKKGALSLLSDKSEKYNTILAEKIISFQADLDLTLNCFIRELVSLKKKDLIIVLDNCDKRNLEEQLLMFEVANWIKDNVKAIVFFPLRDTTFDHFRNEKPLDTVVKDLIFRISPPPLEKVILERIKYANSLAEKSENRTYLLPNGWTVPLPSEDELHYLSSILTSLFQNNFFKRLITGLAGRDVRKGIEIFLDFCQSGHITDGDILKMKQFKGKYILPNHIISRVFIRGNRLYYNDSTSRLKNLFHSDPSEDLPDPFARLAILAWLNERKRKKGPSGIIGFHGIEPLIADMLIEGHSQSRILHELHFLLKHSLIISESQNLEKLELEELIAINPPGVVQLELINNVDYLSACAENTWYKTVSVAEKIALDMSGRGDFSHLSIQNNINHAELLIDYLAGYYSRHFGFQSEFISETSRSQPCDFDEVKKSIQTFTTAVIGVGNVVLESGSIHTGKVVNIQPYGIFCEIPGSIQTGLLHSSELPEDFASQFKVGETLSIKIVSFEEKHGKYKLKLS